MSTRSNPYSLSWGMQFPGSAPENEPSVLGALPTPTLPRSSNLHLFQFVNPNPTILNSTVLGLGNRPVFSVVSDNNPRGYTTFKDVENRTMAAIEWQALPTVEIRGRVNKVPVRDWMRMSTDPNYGRSVRIMDFRGARFIWAPHQESLRLYRLGSSQPCVTVEKVGRVVNLELTQEALVFELLEPCIVSVTLLLSGRRLE